MRGFVHQVRGGGAPKRAKDLVQRKRRNKVLRESLHQVRRVEAPKRAKDMVQGKRRNKVLRAVKHHVVPLVFPFGVEDVVPRDDGIRVCGGWSTTSVPVSAHPNLGAWCLRTKKQGIAGSEAPRQCRRRPIRPWGRGASRRRNKGLRGVKHHVSAGVGPSGPGDVVPPDEETRDCWGWSTTSVRASAHPDLGTWCFLRPESLIFSQ